jgi:hypothetical protein
MGFAYVAWNLSRLAVAMDKALRTLKGVFIGVASPHNLNGSLDVGVHEKNQCDLNERTRQIDAIAESAKAKDSEPGITGWETGLGGVETETLMPWWGALNIVRSCLVDSAAVLAVAAGFYSCG